MAGHRPGWHTSEVPDSPDLIRSEPPATGPPPPADLAALRRRTSAVLAGSQVLGGLGVATGIALAPVLVQQVSGSEAVAGFAQTAAIAGSAALSVPLAALMSARGRRPGLTTAYLVGAVGAAVVVLAAVVGSLPLLLLGMTAFGASSAANLQARFAAADLAEEHQRARAISRVVWATTIGAVTGPNIAAPAGRSVAGLGVPAAAGPFLWAGVVFLLCAVLISVLLRPDPLLTARALAPAEADPRAGRSLRAGAAAVLASPRARLALLTASVCHTAMVAVMVMTPVELGHHDASIEVIGVVISLHIAGMYAFAPVMGWLSDRIGRLGVIGLAMALLASATLLAGTADGSHRQTAAGLFLLGLGWSAGLVAGSALLTDSVAPAARPAAQGLSDLVAGSCAGLGGALSGVIAAQGGYGALNLAAALLLLPVAAVALASRGGRVTSAAGGS